MSSVYMLVIALTAVLNVGVAFGMRARGSSTRPPVMVAHEHFFWQSASPAQDTSGAAKVVPPQTDELLQANQVMYRALESLDREFVDKKILNPDPEMPNPIDVNAPIVVDPSEFYVITPLGLAAFWGWPDIIGQLCAKGALVNEPMPPNAIPFLRDLTPLHIAVMFNRIQAAQVLLSYGADVQAKVRSTTQYNGLTPLDIALKMGPQFNEMARLLVQHGAQSSNPLMREGSPDQQSLLLARYRTQNKMESDPSTFDFEGETPLIRAIRTGNVALVQALVSQGSNPDTPIAGLEHNKNAYAGFSPLCLAVLLGNDPIVETLLQHGANPNYVITDNENGWNGFSPLHIAIIRNKPEVVVRLINRHADINKPMATNEKGYKLTPLGLAASMGYSGIIQILARAGAAIDYTVDGFTPLHHAILQKRYKAFVTLINNGAMINAVVNNPAHKLHNFNTVCLTLKHADNKELAILAKLIQLGADVRYTIKSSKEFSGYTPLTLAIHTGNLQAIKHLIGAGVDLRGEPLVTQALNYLKQNATPTMYSAIESYIGKARLSQQLLEMSRQFNQLFLELYGLHKQHKDMSIDKLAPYKIANMRGILKIMQDILIMGGDPNIKNKHGWTPLLFAIARNDTEMDSLSDELIDALLAHGASPDSISYEGLSPLLLATTYNNIRVVKKLLDAGADPQPDLGKKPLDTAKSQGYTDIEKLLEKSIKEKTKKPSRISRLFDKLSKARQ